MEDFRQSVDYQTIKRYERILTEYLTELYSTGLTIDDYFDIGWTINSLYGVLNDTYKDFTAKYGSRSQRKRKQRYNKLCGLPPCWSKEEIKEYIIERNYMQGHTKILNGLLYDFKRLQALLKEKLIGYTLEEFIERETSLTHLVYTHSHFARVKLHSKNSFMFICPIHKEKTPSFSVDNMNRSGHCYGCGKTLKPISFVERVEYLETPDAMNLLANIYYLSVPGQKSDENEELIEKYRASLISPEFQELLISGRERTKKQTHTAQILSALDTYERDLQTIERVKRAEPLSYTDPKTLGKRLVLEFPFSSNNSPK